MARLGDICEILDSKRIPITASNRKAGIYPYYGANGIQDYVDDYIFDDELVLLAEDGGHFGSTDKPIAYRVSGKCWVNNHAHVLKPKAILDVDYLCYSLMFRDVSNIVNGATRQKLTQADMREIEIPLLTLGEQLAIVEKLNKIFALISLRKQQLSKLDELVKSRFVELFGDPMTNSNGYVLKKYGDLFELNAGGTPSKQKSEYWDNGTISWIGSNMCQNTVIYENDGNYITEEGLKHSSARMFPVDTVLIALVGATIGKTALLKFETTTNQNVLGVRGIRESGYTPEFIFHYTQGIYQKFLNIGDGGFAMASKGFISELPVPVVDLALQEQFAAFVEQIDKSKFEIQQSLEKLETLKKALMQKYFG
jgi:type I restriction enzyme S subunit